MGGPQNDNMGLADLMRENLQQGRGHAGKTTIAIAQYHVWEGRMRHTKVSLNPPKSIGELALESHGLGDSPGLA